MTSLAQHAKRGFVWPFPSDDIGVYGGQGYFATTGASRPDQEPPPAGFAQLVDGPFRSNAVVFACEQKRVSIFSEALFVYQSYNKGLPGRLWSDRSLDILERPWPRGTTRDLMAEALVMADLGGNGYIARRMDGGPDRLRVMRPDWVTIVMGDSSGRPVESAAQLDCEILGFIYAPQDGQTAAEVLLADEVAHFIPPGLRDPLSRFRGMTWLTPVIREVQADQAATMHKLKFFENGATPQLVVSFDATVTEDQFKAFVMKMDDSQSGWRNAYKCLHPETEVALWNGARSRADEIEPGDLVVSWADNGPVPGQVSRVEVQPASPIVEVATQRGRTIKTNEPHPFLTNRGWVAAGDLVVGDRLVTGLGWGRPRLQDSLTPAESWLLGVLTGDGSMVGSTPIVSVADPGILAGLRLMATLNKTDNPRAPHDYRVIGIVPLVRSAGMEGKRAWEKAVPPAVMTGGADVVGSFISGLIDSDGHVCDPASGRTEVGITSTSLQLLTDVQHLLASLDVNASISQPSSMRVDAAGGGSGVPRRHDGYRLCVFGAGQAARLESILALRHEEKARRLREHAKRSSTQDRSRFDRVISVRVLPAEPTIGIEVFGHHTHVTGGVVTHNTLYLGGGADVTAVGKDLQQLDFSNTQGKGETRIIAAAGLHPVILPSSEGMQGSSLNAGNYAAARRSVADTTFRPLWGAMAGSIEAIVPAPTGSRLWYYEQGVAFLREDAADAAKIEQVKAETINGLVREGFTAKSAVAAVMAQDMSLLEHTNYVSVQLQQLGATTEQPALPAPKPPLAIAGGG